MTYEESVNTYKEYIKSHIDNVHKAFDKYGKILSEKLNIDINRLKDIINIHDQSKFSDEEFNGYRLKYYPSDEDFNDTSKDLKEVNELFQLALDHHYNVNAHHPEFWVTKDNDDQLIINEMSNLYIAEMLLDWAAVSMNNKNSVYDFYYSIDGGQKKPLHQNTRIKIENVIGVFKEG